MADPKIFISYTHESESHKDWTALLATRLRERGVDVTLDQWELFYGSDLTLFMEKAIREADRVLLICTPTYREKSDSGTGGVAYERMIVTGELAQNIATTKFICVLRAGDPSSALPSYALGRLFVDFRHDAHFEQSLEVLIRDLYRMPRRGKLIPGKATAYAPTRGETPTPSVSGTWEDWHRLQLNQLTCLTTHTNADFPILLVEDDKVWESEQPMSPGSRRKIDAARSFHHSARVQLLLSSDRVTDSSQMAEIVVSERELGADGVTQPINVGRARYRLRYSVAHFLRRVDGYDIYESGSRGFSVLVPRRLRRNEGAVSGPILEKYSDERLTLTIAADDAQTLEAFEHELLDPGTARVAVRAATRETRRYGTRKGTYLHLVTTDKRFGVRVRTETHYALAPTSTGFVAAAIGWNEDVNPDASEAELIDTVMRSLSVK